MTLQQLHYFIVLADMLHYTKAAQKLYISQPSLSRAVSELEKELGAPLFAKDGKLTMLTDYGKAFLPYAKESIAKIDTGKKVIQEMLVPSTSVRLGYIYSLSFSILPGILENFLAQEENRDTQFTFFQGMAADIVDKLKKGELDIALSVRADDDAISENAIFRQELYLVVPKGHRLAQKEQVVLEDLENESFVTINANSSLRRQLDSAFETLNATPRITFEAEECNAMASFVSANLGVAIMPEIPALRSYNVEVLPIEGNLLKRKIYALCAKDHQLSSAATRFRNYLLERCAEGFY